MEHSDLAHGEMALHRNLALASVAMLLITALWRWRRPYSPAAALFGLTAAVGLAGTGYLGGDLVYRHAIGISTEQLEEVAHERGGHAHVFPERSKRRDGAPQHHH